MPACRCVVQDCINKSNPRAGISLQFLWPKSSQEVVKWKAFVGIHRAYFNPKGLFKICSIHFAADCFERQVHIEGQPRNLVLGAIPRAVTRIFCLWGQIPHTPHRGLPYADRVSSWTLILFSLLQRKLPLRCFEKKNTDAFCFKLS